MTTELTKEEACQKVMEATAWAIAHETDTDARRFFEWEQKTARMLYELKGVDAALHFFWIGVTATSPQETLARQVTYLSHLRDQLEAEQ